MSDTELVSSPLTIVLTCSGHSVLNIKLYDPRTPSLRAPDFDLLLIDVGSSALVGCELLCRLRLLSNIPIIIRYPSREEELELLSLRLEADDCIYCNSSTRLQEQRIKAIIRRTSPPGLLPLPTLKEQTSSSLPTFADEWLTIDVALSRTFWGHHLINLNTIERLLLLHIARNAGTVFSRRSLLQSLYGTRCRYRDEIIDSHIVRIRRKVREHCPSFDAIEAIRGLGYRYISPIA
ncbi:MAG: winged helix-turn-helix transcriptional regulator [Caulobacteraceae bacterium]